MTERELLEFTRQLRVLLHAGAAQVSALVLARTGLADNDADDGAALL